MHSRSALTIVVFLAMTGVASAIDLQLAFEPPSIQMTELGERILVPGARLQAQPGEPLLPVATFWLLLPPGCEPGELRIEGQAVEALPGLHRPLPAQRPRPLSRSTPPVPTAPDAAIYGGDAPWPNRWFRKGALQFLHGCALLPVDVFPLRWEPKTGRMTRLVSARLRLETRPGGPVPRVFRARSDDLAAVMRMAADSSALIDYPAGPVDRGVSRLDDGEFDYLIIAPGVFVGLGGDDSLEALRDARELTGLASSIVSLEWIQTHYPGTRPDGGADDATRIREFLTDAYAEWGVRHALLVGDADAADVGGESGDMLMPVRGLYVNMGYDPEIGAEIADQIPADMYYGCLDGSFDFDADGVYGEHGDGLGGGEVDLLAEIAVGRAPVDSEQELRQFVAKTLAYDQAAGSWLSDVWMLGEWLFDGPVWGGDYMDELIHGASTGGTTTLGFDSLPFFACHTLYDRDLGGPDAWGPGDLVPLLDEGPHVVNHLGHSDVTYNMRLEIHQADALINSHSFLLYSQGCLAGSFDNRGPAEYGDWFYDQDSIGEHFVCGEHGPAAAVLNSRYGLGSYGTDGPSQRFHREFWDAFFSEGKTRLGEALADAKDDNAPGMGDDWNRWAGYTVNLLGDPALVLHKSINTDQPLLGVYPPELRTYAAADDPGSASTAVLHVRNDGVGALGFEASCPADWLSISPNSGTAPRDLDVQIDPTGLEAGEYESSISFSSPEAANSPVEVPVGLLVVEVPAERVPHTERAPVLDGSISAGEYADALVLPVDLEGGSQVELRMLVCSDKLHIACEDTLDESSGDHDHILLLFDRDLDGAWPVEPGEEGLYLCFGDYTLFVPVYNSGGGYQIDYYGAEEFPAGLRSRRGMQAGHRVYELEIDLQTSHVDVGPHGSFGAYFQVINALGWGDEEVDGVWPRLPEIDDQRFFGLLDMAPDSPELRLEPEALDLVCTSGREAASAIVAVSDASGLEVACEVDLDGAAGWLEVEPQAAVCPAELEVRADCGSLPPGQCSSAFSLVMPGAWNSPQRVSVRLQVEPQPARLVVEPAAFELAASLGGPDPQLEMRVSNAGDRVMDFELHGAPTWLALGQGAGRLNPGHGVDLAIPIRLDEAGLGLHAAELSVEAPGADGSPAAVTVELEVVVQQPVPEVSDLRIEEGDRSLHLSWVLPGDPLVAGVQVQRALLDAPADPGSGQEVFSGLASEFGEDGLVDGVTYCYSVFSRDAAYRFSGPVSICGVPGANHAPAIPQPLRPADGELVSSPVQLVCGSVLDPDGDEVTYVFQILDAGLLRVLDSGTGQDLGGEVTYSPAIELAPGGRYRWQVEAVDAAGLSSGLGRPSAFEVRAGEGCACGTGSGPALWALAVLLAGAMRRRRRSP
ncbi:MAG: hypothetical protein JXR96_10340 [Deltaproteobacteria bacterium]|nr:hypothetical protein [Deltaproteobacteria bacterium]